MKISVTYEPSSDENRALAFDFNPSSLTSTEAEALRPKIDFAIARLFLVRDRCMSLLELTSRERAKRQLEQTT